MEAYSITPSPSAVGNVPLHKALLDMVVKAGGWEGLAPLLNLINHSELQPNWKELAEALETRRLGFKMEYEKKNIERCIGGMQAKASWRVPL